MGAIRLAVEPLAATMIFASKTQGQTGQRRKLQPKGFSSLLAMHELQTGDSPVAFPPNEPASLSFI
jgi:hypothetical protein